MKEFCLTKQILWEALKFQCGFRKGYSMQQFFRKSFGALLTDLSKVFDCLPHELLIPKLEIYGFSLAALRLAICLTKNKGQKQMKVVVLGKQSYL